MSKNRAIVVVDMINAYMTPDSKLNCKEAHSIVENINKLTGRVRSSGGLVVFANTSLVSSEDPIAKRWGLHARRDTTECNVYPDIDTRPMDQIVLKRSYNSFYETDLDLTLRSNSIRTLLVVGIHTHVCVLLTASAASDRGYDVVAFQDAMTTGYQPNHDTRLRFFSSHVGELTTTAQYLKDR